MLDLLRARLRGGLRTLSFPAGAAPLPSRFRGRPAFNPGACPDGCRDCRARSPSPLLVEGPAGHAVLDVGACLFSPDEAAACPAGAVAYTGDYRMAATARADLLTPDGHVALARQLERGMRRVLGRSLRLRSVVAGSCNGCEAELVALGNVMFDLARYGIQFVASPRHADGLVVTGAVNTNMTLALRKTYEAVPDPKIVIAVGACAVTGGPFRGSPEVAGGVGDLLPVDLWIPGCPPHPYTLLDGLLRMLGRLDPGGDTARTEAAD
ncbi:MAG TPA: NADH-quinone oxidoreductase subunit NuoB [Gemmatimonadales bacterium]|nr:NADH-quinone oxidoreductase subunit NuoB [Gemmatimonadales bacterium]